MRAYKISIKITILISALSLSGAIFLHYNTKCANADFWVNVCLGIFGSAFLTLITSIISYKIERRKTLESFVYNTRHILSYMNKYQDSMSLEQKIHFFIDYAELDKSEWDKDFGNIDFFFDRFTNNRKYIYEHIYSPVLKFNRAVASHMWHFRWHLDGTGKNDAIMQKFVADLQEYLLEKCESDIPTEYDEKGNIVSSCHSLSVQPKLEHNIRKELNGRYYEIMYGKKFAQKQRKLIDGGKQK